MYSAGVVSWCPRGPLNQAVLVVGYGTETSGSDAPPIGFFEVRNAWGSDWGERGNIRLERGYRDFGTCEVAARLTYPTLLPSVSKARSAKLPRKPTPTSHRIPRPTTDDGIVDGLDS
ncbi:hypothetical protein SDRG_12745 [Saprolegnia diclina VS20]|uniref:Peptidase C1A papain C-terminal domain-containing protein n=1 Tax=Saprolegnia diclina (strain VS20) TaxID=1156394 RepID=T0RI75_SAPDV|nr:hypothetical protein SDRG_12745 [Saprolegnia diclina VS20]EQC29497.1 hypothetical protein SDRG_12745 [Saprolegnia diclina VS20]|eukprot:XP_008617049.1 hypothetical protein SDRG_12745 [Saprolegnia diclina VS20]